MCSLGWPKQSGADHLRRILKEAQILAGDALAASPQQPGIPPKMDSKERP